MSEVSIEEGRGSSVVRKTSGQIRMRKIFAHA